MRSNPLRQCLARRGFGKKIPAGSEYPDKKLDGDQFPGLRVDDMRSLTGVVRKDLLSRTVALPQTRVEPLHPTAVHITELTVPIPLRVRLKVLQPQQLQCDPGAFQLSVDGFADRSGARDPLMEGPAKECAF